MTWFDLAYASLTAAGIVVIPGLVLAVVLGLRGLWAWGMAAPFGITVIALASLVAPMLGVAWGIWAVLGVFVIIAAGLGAVRALLRGRGRRPARSARPAMWWAPVVSLLVAALLIGAQVVQTIQAPGNISQTFDNIFHLNGIRFALDTANASPLHLGTMTSTSGGVWFYPSAWHAWGSLVLQLTGVDIAVVANSVVIVTASVIWPASAVLLTRTAFGSSSALLIGAGVFAAALPTMPLLMMNYGVLYPFQLGLAIAPAAVAAVLVLLRLPQDQPAGAYWAWVVALLGSLPGLVLAHPGAFMAWLVLASIAVLVAHVVHVRTRPARRSLILALTGFASWVLAAIVAWRLLRPPADARGWPPSISLGQAVGEAITLSFWWGAIPVVAVAALIVGIVVTARSRTAIDVWVVASFAAASVLYIASVALPWPVLRDLMTAPWYNNAPRLAAIVPIVVVPLAARATESLWSRLDVRLQRGAQERGRRRVLAAVAVVVALVVTTQLGAVRLAVQQAAATYALTADSALVSADEMALLRRLSDTVPPDAVVAGSPWTGAGLAYAIASRHVLMPHTLMDIDDDTALINSGLNEADLRPDVCAALERKHVAYVLDFGDREVHGAHHEFRGLERLARSNAVEVADSEGRAVLYRITACEVGA